MLFVHSETWKKFSGRSPFRFQWLVLQCNSGRKCFLIPFICWVSTIFFRVLVGSWEEDVTKSVSWSCGSMAGLTQEDETWCFAARSLSLIQHLSGLELCRKSVGTLRSPQMAGKPRSIDCLLMTFLCVVFDIRRARPESYGQKAQQGSEQFRCGETKSEHVPVDVTSVICCEFLLWQIDVSFVVVFFFGRAASPCRAVSYTVNTHV